MYCVSMFKLYCLIILKIGTAGTFRDPERFGIFPFPPAPGRCGFREGRAQLLQPEAAGVVMPLGGRAVRGCGMFTITALF